MRVFVTGGAGFIGSLVAKKLIDAGDRVAVYDQFINYIEPSQSTYQKNQLYRLKHFLKGVEIIRGDVRKKECVVAALKKFKPQAIIHMAALPLTVISNRIFEDIIDINLNGTVSVLEAIKDCDSVDRFIFTSSSMVYGNFKYEPADEGHQKNPIELYGGTKLSGEIITKSFCQLIGKDYTIIRPSAVYGPTDANRRVVQIFIENALRGKPLVLHSKGNSRLDLTFVDDVANGFFLALKSKKAANQTFNMTCGRAHSLKELAEMIKRFIPGIQIKFEKRPHEENKPERGALDISKAKKVLGYKPRVQLEEGLKMYIDFIKKNRCC